MLKPKEKALQNKELAYAIVGQALLDERSILTNNLEIFYNDEETARYLFDIAKRWGLADTFKVKRALNQIKYGFTIKAEARAPLYEKIGPLPDKARDTAFKHLLRPLNGRPRYPQGVAKSRTIASLEQEPKTVRQLSYEPNLSGSSVKQHLNDLKASKKVTIIGKNVNSIKGKRKCAFIWGVVPHK